MPYLQTDNSINIYKLHRCILIYTSCCTFSTVVMKINFSKKENSTKLSKNNIMLWPRSADRYTREECIMTSLWIRTSRGTHLLCTKTTAPPSRIMESYCSEVHICKCIVKSSTVSPALWHTVCYFMRLSTLSVMVTSAFCSSEGLRVLMTLMASWQCWRARNWVCSSPSLLCTRSKAFWTSPGSWNLRMIIGFNSGN